MGNDTSTPRCRNHYLGENFKHSIMNNHSPIVFHDVHGDNIKLSNGGSVACREEGFCKGITFSNRPVKVNEYIYVKFKDISTSWSGALRIGFTSNNPVNFRSSLPRYACPDLTNRPGYWAKALAERFAKQDSILYYYVDESGDVHYGVDDEDIGVFFSGVITSSPLWALMDIYGNTRAIQLIAPHSVCSEDPSAVNMESFIGTSGPLNLKSLHFHRIHGKNVAISKNRSVATRRPGAHDLAYLFTADPVCVEEKIILKVLDVDTTSEGNLVLGVTSCNPQRMDEDDLPTNCEDLLDRSEYWVVWRDKKNSNPGDIIVCNISSDGKLQMSRNAEPLNTVVYVDHTLPLWFFFHLSGKTRQIQFIGSTHTLPDSVLVKVKGTPESGDNPVATSSDCVICYEKPIDCVLYRCGHMCLCHKCAQEIFKLGSPCPVCRTKIEDVVKTFYR